jgi:superfamily II DNA or RNA helicase
MIQRFLEVSKFASSGSALVRMPTGTGKSGVIAIAAQRLVAGEVLVITPWDHLVKQLLADIENRFFERSKVDLPQSKSVTRLLPSNAGRAFETDASETVWVTTTATLERLHRDDLESYESLRQRVQLVLVDEGHYEPARSWSVAVRELSTPTVLLTATPYRNDLKAFNLDPAHVFHLTHKEAEDEHLLRKVRFRGIDFSTPEEFCSQLVDIVDSRRGVRRNRKIIIRCDSRSQIYEVVATLRDAGQSAIGIHHTFDSDDGMYRSTVPDPAGTSATYWVHQHMLTEGIDSSDFGMVAFYRPSPGERAFVQQVGRILRNPSRAPNDHADVIFRNSDRLDEAWDSYRAYDVDTEATLFADPLDWIIVRPPPMYSEGKFRGTFDFAHGSIDVDDILFHARLGCSSRLRASTCRLSMPLSRI